MGCNQSSVPWLSWPFSPMEVEAMVCKSNSCIQCFLCVLNCFDMLLTHLFLSYKAITKCLNRPGCAEWDIGSIKSYMPHAKENAESVSMSLCHQQTWLTQHYAYMLGTLDYTKICLPYFYVGHILQTFLISSRRNSDVDTMTFSRTW